MVNRASAYARPLALAIASIAITVFARPVPAQPRPQEGRRPVEITVSAKKYSFTPARIEVQEDDIVKITLKSEDVPHSFTIDRPYLVAKRAVPGRPVTFEIHADKPGSFIFYCNITTDDKCKDMKGELVVRPRK